MMFRYFFECWNAVPALLAEKAVRFFGCLLNAPFQAKIKIK